LQSFRCGGGLIKTLPAAGGKTGGERRGGESRGKVIKGGEKKFRGNGES